MYDLLQGTVLLQWATVAADDAYSNGQHIVTPYSRYGLSVMKDTFNFYLSSCRMIVEQIWHFELPVWVFLVSIAL